MFWGNKDMPADLSHSLFINLKLTKVTSSKVLCTNVRVSLMVKEVFNCWWTVIICEQTRHWMLCWASWIQCIFSDTISRIADRILSSALPTTVASLLFSHVTSMFLPIYLIKCLNILLSVSLKFITNQKKVSTFMIVYVFLSCCSVSFRIAPVQLHMLITVLCYSHINHTVLKTVRIVRGFENWMHQIWRRL
jgi:hypothetical protein